MYWNKTLTMAALAAAMSLAGCGGEKQHAESKKAAGAAPVSVTVVKAAEESVADTYEATGTVKARTTTVLSARVMGYVREIRAQAGDSVRAGQVVAVIEAREIDTGLRQAEAARGEAQGGIPEANSAIAAAQAHLELADITYKRMKTLLDQKSITSQEFDEVSAKRRMAQANYEMARARRAQLDLKIKQADEAVAQAAVMKGYMEVIAPFAGTVVERKAEPGMLASPGVPLLVVEQAGDYRLEAQVGESLLGKIRPGMKVQVELESADKPLEARVEEIVPALDASSRTFTVKIGLHGGQLRSGMFGRARFPMGEKKALMIPATAVMRPGQLESVFVAESGIARTRMITTGAATRGHVEVLSGLGSGESVVAQPPAALADGSKIEVRQ